MPSYISPKTQKVNLWCITYDMKNAADTYRSATLEHINKQKFSTKNKKNLKLTVYYSGKPIN